VIDRLAYFIATAGFVGRFPIAPGTAGSVAGLVLYGLIRLVDVAAIEPLALVITFVVGIWSANIAERLLGGKDPGPVVIDEVLGVLITFAFLDVNVTGAITGFFLFRVFDVIKPYPAGRLEILPGGFGVMMDDAMAGLYSHASLRLLVIALPDWFVR
jgi:phosphatidylglycerophosphatase A